MWTTRKIASSVLMAVALTAGSAAQAVQAESTGTGADVRCGAVTSLGAVEGTADGGVCAYRGIPYAQPPTGPLRFQPPQAVRPWQGTLRANDGQRICAQDRDDMTEDYPTDARADEDCLYLNVWTPAKAQAKRPVLVFVHGGAARFGTGNEPRYAGKNLAQRGDAVVVTLNYRLGVFGYTDIPGLDGSGNNGLRDQLAALQWVQDHIADFGGNPDNVTVAGESAGAFSISAMLATEHPQRLFRRAILQSGNGYLVRSPLAAAQASGLVVGGRTAGELREMSTDQLLGLQRTALEQVPMLSQAVFFGAYADGTLVKGPIGKQVAAGNARGIDLIVGTTRDEVHFWAQFAPDLLKMPQEAYDAYFPHELADQRAHMVKVYKQAGRPNEVLAMLTDQTLRVPATRLAEAQSRWGRSYVYQFDWAPPKGIGAIHTIELPFVFGTLRFTGIPGGAEALEQDRVRLTRLSHQMMDAWTAFARSGDPGWWPTYTPRRRDTMIWDVPAHVVRAPHEAERALWNGYAFDHLR